MRGLIGLLMLLTSGAGAAGYPLAGAGASPGLAVTGRVIDPSGKPAGGAAVVINLWSPRGAARAWNRPPARYQTMADAHGVFRLEVPATGEDWEATLLALKAGYGPGGQALHSPGTPRGLTVALTHPGFAAGRVVDRAGQPVAGAVVSVRWMTRPDGDESLRLMGAGPTATTDAQGRFRLWPLPAGAAAVLAAEHSHFAAMLGGSELLPTGTDDAVLTLAPPGAVAGRVLLPDGRPAARAPVHCQGIGMERVTETDAGGQFRLARLPAGDYLFRVAPAGTDLVSEIQGVALAEGAEARCPDLRLAPGGIVTGHVTDEKGAPLAGIGILSQLDRAIAGLWMSAEGPSTRTDRDGRYRLRLPPTGPPPRALPGPPPGWHVKSDLYPEGAFGDQEERTIHPGIQLHEGETVRVDLTLPRPVRLHAQVLDARGRPAAGATAQTSHGWALETERTDDTGRFAVDGLVPTLPAKLLVFSRDRREGARLDVTPGQVHGEQVIRLQELPAVTGVVRDKAGKPVPGAVVGAERIRRAGFSTEIQVTSRTVADDQGRFSLSLFPDAPYQVSAGAFGFGPGQPVSVEIGPAGRDATTTAPLEFVLERADAIVAGIVLDQNGQPAAGASVEVEQSDPVHGRYRLGRAMTDAQGRFRIGHLPPGEVQIGASRQRSFSDRRSVPAGATDLRLVLIPWEDPASAPGPAKNKRPPRAASRELPSPARPDGTTEIALRYTLDPVGPPIATLGQRLSISTTPPAGLKLPRFVSDRPLFLTARLGDGSGSLFPFALDETVRGGGYDRLYADPDQTGDLTAAPPVLLSRWRDKKGFKPVRLLVRVPSGRGGRRVPYDAAIVVDDRSSPPEYRLHPWGYFSGEGQLGEKRYAVALVDNNGNGRYGDIFRGSTDEQAGDILLVDVNGDGRFDQWEFAGPEFRPCARWLFFDDRWYELAVRPDGSSFSLRPAAVPLATLRSDYPRFRLLLTSENGLLAVYGRGGQATVPAGDYRLSGWEVEQRDRDGSTWVAQGDYRRAGEAMPALSARAETPLPKLGAPLVAGLEVTPTSEREFQVTLRFTAATGELIDLVSRNGRRMPEPHLKITDARGREIANLPFEYG